MTTTGEMLEAAARIVRNELPEYLPGDLRMNDVRAECLPGPDGEDYIHVNVILEDGHADIDVKRVLEFNRKLRPLFESAGVKPAPAISYSSRSEVAR